MKVYPHRITFGRKLFVAFVLLTMAAPPVAFADTLYLKSGKKIDVEKLWRKGDRLFFIYHGIEADIPQSKVLHIDHASVRPSKKATEKKGKPADSKNGDAPPQSSSAPTPDQKNTPPAAAPAFREDGFRDLHWGINVSDVHDLKIKPAFSDMDKVIEYVRPSDTLHIHESKLASISYSFWRDRLYTVTIWTVGHENYVHLREAVFAQFGKGRRPDQTLEKYLWSQPQTDMMLEYDKIGELGMLWLRSVKLDRKHKMKKLHGHSALLKWMKSK